MSDKPIEEIQKKHFDQLELEYRTTKAMNRMLERRLDAFEKLVSELHAHFYGDFHSINDAKEVHDMLERLERRLINKE